MMKSAKEKVLSVIARTPEAEEDWVQEMIDKAVQLMERGSPESLLHTMAMIIPPERLHGRHTKIDIETLLAFEDEHLNNLSREY